MSRTRSTARRPARRTAKLSCQVVRERDFSLVADRVVNLSPWGALVGPADPVLTGEPVIVSFAAPGGKWIDAEATVARVSHGRRRNEDVRRLGLRFEKLDASSSRALKELLKACLVSPPGTRKDRREIPRPPKSVSN